MNGRHEKKTRIWRRALFWLLVLAIPTAAMQLAEITCPIRYLVGISCPGCGMTRACLSALHMDFSAAFAYHPLWGALPPVAALVLAFHCKHKTRALSVLILTFATAMVVVYLGRMLLQQGDVVIFAPSQGQIGKWIHHWKEMLP